MFVIPAKTESLAEVTLFFWQRSPAFAEDDEAKMENEMALVG